MMISTQQIRELRDQYVHDRKRFFTGPQKTRMEAMIAILNEVLEYRDAEEQAEEPREPEGYFRRYSGRGRVPVEGTVR